MTDPNTAWRTSVAAAQKLDLDRMQVRTQEWAKPVMPSRGERGGGSSSPSDSDLLDRMQDRQASRYDEERRQILKRMTDDADRLVRLDQILFPPQSRTISRKDLQSVQIAAEGWCVSCWRDDQNCTPIPLRPAVGDQPAHPYYRDRCRFCGAWKAEHGQDPPLPLVKLKHAGRRITQQDVDKALAEVNPKRKAG